MGFLYHVKNDTSTPIDPDAKYLLDSDSHWSDVDDDSFKMFICISGLIVSLGVAALVYWLAK
jgi:hypothetical protein